MPPSYSVRKMKSKTKKRQIIITAKAVNSQMHYRYDIHRYIGRHDNIIIYSNSTTIYTKHSAKGKARDAFITKRN